MTQLESLQELDDFKGSIGNVIRDIFVKTKPPPLSLNYFTTNTQAYFASVQVSSGYKDKEIYFIECHNIAPIYVEEVRTYDPIFFLQEKGIQKSSSTIIL